MKTILLKNLIFATGLLSLGLTGVSRAQTPETTPAKKVNFGYSQNPKTRTNKDSSTGNQEKQNSNEPTENGQTEVVNNNQGNETIAKKTLEVVKNANKKALAPTEHYKVGPGDILFINLQNSSKGSTYFTVLNDGTIDYPLAGEMISVLGLNTDEIEELLRDKIKLYENPQISVKVREYSSHKITVIGLVEKSGEKFIQREAVPLFVVRAEAIVQPKANRVVVRRADSSTETFSLKDDKSENILIFPNDIVEFSTDDAQTVKNSQAQFFYIGGEVTSTGQKEFYEGLTLTQAILASGGLKKESAKKVVIRRKNAEGLLVSTEYNLRLIKDGKVPDPVLQAGDTIEIGN
jgi:protein involved in polysaccharide export with SLBB domain